MQQSVSIFFESKYYSYKKTLSWLCWCLSHKICKDLLYNILIYDKTLESRDCRIIWEFNFYGTLYKSVAMRYDYERHFSYNSHIIILTNKDLWNLRMLIDRSNKYLCCDKKFYVRKNGINIYFHIPDNSLIDYDSVIRFWKDNK